MPIAKAPQGGAETGPATQALYDRGYTLFHQGRYVDAEASFQRFLQANPTNELADNAEYWIGECRYSRGDLRGALAAFRETVQRYPEGNKVPDALLKAGQCLESLGNVAEARLTYKEVIRRFSGSAAAAVAEERQAKLPQ
jgi:tol-pal system protein YbgF